MTVQKLEDAILEATFRAYIYGYFQEVGGPRALAMHESLGKALGIAHDLEDQYAAAAILRSLGWHQDSGSWVAPEASAPFGGDMVVGRLFAVLDYLDKAAEVLRSIQQGRK